jgi:NAD(P)-dependent dehydrogenase (short-subunit alcohol dehydrogenase family)
MTQPHHESRPFAASSGLLEGRVAIITGASRGIGAAAARAFAQAGAAVALAARDEAALTALAGEIEQSGGRALAVPTDVGDAAAMERLVRQTVQTYGRLDAAFNNAGDNHALAPLADIAVEDFDRVLRVNLRGIFLAMKYEIRAMLEHGGAIVNMSSTAGLSGARGIGSYAASKHGAIGLTKVAALDYGERNIRVNALAPGPIVTSRLAQAPEAARQQVANFMPLRRLGRPEEVAQAAAWLCSDQASFITGATLAIDGGRLAGF